MWIVELCECVCEIDGCVGEFLFGWLVCVVMCDVLCEFGIGGGGGCDVGNVVVVVGGELFGMCVFV